MSKTIVKSVLGVLIIDQKVVLVKRRDIPVWVLPGGGIDEGETAEECIVREVKEETGYDAKIDRRVALYTSTSRFLTPVYLFQLSPISKTGAAFDTNEVKDLGLFSQDLLPQSIVHMYIDWIKDTFENKPYFEKVITTITPFYLIKSFLKQPIISIRFLLMRCGIHINS